MNHSDYQRPLFDVAAMHEAADAIMDEIDALPARPDFLAVRGMSGATLGVVVSYLTYIPLVIVRKPDDQYHSSCGDVQGPRGLDGGRYVIVDDLVSSGDTVRAIHTALTIDNPANVLDAIIVYSAQDSASSVTLDGIIYGVTQVNNQQEVI